MAPLLLIKLLISKARVKATKLNIKVFNIYINPLKMYAKKFEKLIERLKELETKTQ